LKYERVVSQLPVIAMWEHGEEVYKLNKDGLIRTLYNRCIPYALCNLQENLHTLIDAVFNWYFSMGETYT
jgi:hypothetical protein